MMTEIAIFKEDHMDLKWTINDANGDPVDITSASLTFSVKKNYDDSSYSFQRKNTAAGGSDAGIEILTGASGICRVKILPDNTSGLDIGSYQYDLEMVVSSKTGTVAQDKFKIKYGIT